ncbi:MAG TPA: 50S ribosomal protein L4 [Methylothermaceae bacterium]|nr:50S ribosomal protein L4 [Methylothermaceae bacterium]
MSVEIPVVNEKDSAQPIAVTDEVFGQPFNEPLVHQVVTTYLNNGRAGTKAQKNRSDVSGGGKKPWRQKGTGRARAGTIRSPIWRGGGVTFAARPRDFTKKLNKKMYRVGMRSIVSELVRQNRLCVSEDLLPNEPKTKAIASKLNQYGLTESVLILVNEPNEILERAIRNLPLVTVALAASVDPVSLVSADKVIAVPAAVKVLEERLG